jgi:anaerobic magnesium-protoporphyrin IX monomethyl ester cyclase
MSDLMLVHPLFLHTDPVEQRLMTPYFPLGLLYLAATARDAGYDVSIFDSTFQAGDSAFQAALERERPRVVGIGTLATTRMAALRLADLAHQRGAVVVMGGPDPTGRPESYLRHRVGSEEPVDVVVVGEGEQTLLELMPFLLDDDRQPGYLATIQGLAYLEGDGQLVTTPPRAHCRELDSLPLPARDLLDIEAYRQAWRSKHGLFSLSIIATRGCPYGCKWCQKSVFGRSYRSRSPESVAAEMQLIKEQYRPDQLRIVDDVLGIDSEWVRVWRDAVVGQDAVIPFECLSRVDLIDEDLVKQLKEAGCIRIAFGAESGSQRVLEAMNKGTTVEQIRRTAELCRRFEIETHFYIMLGYPGEQWADIRKTANLLRDSRPDLFSSTIAYPLPGTQFYDEVQHRLLDAPDWDYTAENRLLFDREYSTRFYRWVQRWLHQEWNAARLQHADSNVPLALRLRVEAGRRLAHGVVQLLRLAHRGPVGEGG